MTPRRNSPSRTSKLEGALLHIIFSLLDFLVNVQVIIYVALVLHNAFRDRGKIVYDFTLYGVTFDAIPITTLWLVFIHIVWPAWCSYRIVIQSKPAGPLELGVAFGMNLWLDYMMLVFLTR